MPDVLPPDPAGGSAVPAPAIDQAAETPRADDERYRALFSAMGHGFCLIEKAATGSGEPSDFRYLAANPAFLHHTGLPDPVGKTILELVPDAEPATMDFYDRVVASGEPERFEAYVAALDLWLEAEAYPDQEPGQVAVLFSNVTARKRAEAALRRNGRWARAQNEAFEAAMDGEPLSASLAILARLVAAETANEARTAFYLADPDGVRLHPVRGAGDMADTYLDEVDGFPIGPDSFACGLAVPTGLPVVTPDVFDEPKWIPWVGRARAHDFRGCWSFPIKTRDRQAVGTFAMYFRAPRNATPQDLELANAVTQAAAVIIVSHTEAAERARAEAALRESEERFRLIVEQATDYSIFTAGPDNRIETWPGGAERVFGWTANEAIGQPIAITYTPEDRAARVPEQEIAAARDMGQTPYARWRQRKDGRQVFIEGVTYARRGEDGAFRGVFKIGQDVTARLAAEETHREEEAAHREEEERIRDELAAQVEAATAELRTLSRRLLTVQEEERRHLARELHDEIGQMLTGLQLQLGAAERDRGALAEASATVQALTEQVRQLSMDLRPAVLDSFGLLTALQWYIERYEPRTGVRVHLRLGNLARRFAPDVEITAYRVVQEALTNVARHAQVDFATVQLHADDGVLTLVVRDAGRGFDLAQPGHSSGLSGMRERVHLLGGTIDIDAMPGGGTVVTADLPLNGDGPTARRQDDKAVSRP